MPCPRPRSIKSEELQSEVECYVNAVMVSFPASEHRLEDTRIELKRDDTLKVVMQYTQHGWPDDKRKLYGPIAKFWGERGNLLVYDDLLLRGRQLVIPPCLRKNILRHLHDGHQGLTRTVKMQLPQYGGMAFHPTWKGWYANARNTAKNGQSQ